MAVRRIIPDMAYGIGDDLIPLAPLPIIAMRDPGIADQAQLGTTWINKSTGAVWVLARIVANASDWVTSPVIGGAGVFTSLQVTSGSLTIDAAAGGIDVGAGNFTVDNAGNTVTEDLTVNGDITLNGDFDLTSAALIDLTSTLNAAPSISLTANGGANEQIYLHSVQGTSATSVDIVSDLGGVHIEGNSNTVSAIVLEAANAAGGVTVSAGTAGIDLTAVNGAIDLVSGTGAINIGADAVAHAITIGNLTGATAVDINSGSGGIGIAALNSAVQVTSGTGQMDLGSDAAATTINLGVAAAAKTVTVGSTNTTSTTAIQSGSGGVSVLATNATLAISSGTGVMNISADAAATTVNIATAAAVKTLTLGSVTGASVSTLRAGTGGLNLTAANGAVVMESGTGAMSISADAAATTLSVGTGAAVKTVSVGSTTAGSTLTLHGPAAVGVTLDNSIRIITGAGSPDTVVTAPAGSIFLRTDPAGATSRMYINTDSATAWTNVDCAA